MESGWGAVKSYVTKKINKFQLKIIKRIKNNFCDVISEEYHDNDIQKTATIHTKTKHKSMFYILPIIFYYWTMSSPKLFYRLRAVLHEKKNRRRKVWVEKGGQGLWWWWLRNWAYI